MAKDTEITITEDEYERLKADSALKDKLVKRWNYIARCSALDFRDLIRVANEHELTLGPLVDARIAFNETIAAGKKA